MLDIPCRFQEEDHPEKKADKWRHFKTENEDGGV